MTAPALYLYDDSQARTFEPYASSRPLSEMRAGTALIRERWTAALGGGETFFLAGDRHADFDEPGAKSATGMIPGNSIIVNSRFAPAIPKDPTKALRSNASCSLWRSGTDLVAVRIKDPINAAQFADGSVMLDQVQVGTGAIGTMEGWWLNEVWDFIRLLPEQLSADINRVHEFARKLYVSTSTAQATTKPPAHATVIGDQPVIIVHADGTQRTVIEPHVVFDASGGPILVQPGTHIRAFTRITGPCYIGREVQVLGGDISVCSVGDVCKVRGEVANTIFLGHSNKGHDGFVGHSYLGRWVNLGASTVTSNLKNTYGTVALWTPGGVRDTGMQFLGTMFGDHVKTGIGLRLTTGCVLGMAANVFDQMPPKVVAPFSWGGKAPYDTYRADKFVETAARAMARRHVELSDRARRHLTNVHAGRWTAGTDAS
ncbi:MAG TPA: putative sugar nucleotidyl transferase [Gemmatimonadaceae bacterium]|jgi:UDP-N-acetylglucosamine diphosphorylase/glucosamine-1-phosphate N-acetyltransferase|nr:putative sugar nucleotidyl transferase [Gemmatimonadaceae bacterium]